MKALLLTAALILLATASPADQLILVYTPGNTLFTQGVGKSITSSTQCADPDVERLLDKYGMSYGYRAGSDLVDILDGYYYFCLDDGKGQEAADSLSAVTTVGIASVNGSVHPLSGSRRTPGDYWYNHTYEWRRGYHHDGCDSSLYMPIPHYRQWLLPRAGYDRAWTVTTGDPDHVIAIIDSSFEVEHDDLHSKWKWNSAEYGGTPGYDDDGNGYVDDELGWDFGTYVFADKDSLPLGGDPDVGHDLRWWELRPDCDVPWDCPCDTTWCKCDDQDMYCDELKTKSGFGSERHGTNMASIIGAQTSEDTTSVGMAGIAWDTRILPIKIGNEVETKIDVPNSLWMSMAKALEYVAIRKQQGLDIIALNMSLTFDRLGNLDMNGRLQYIFDPIFDSLRNEYGIVLLGSAGNFKDEPRDFPIYPCRNTDVFCGTCVGFYDQLHLYSQFGDEGLPPDQENVDLCTYGAEKDLKCGVNRDPGDQICQVKINGVDQPRFPEMIVASSEITHREGWSLCGDVGPEHGCAPSDSCESGLYDEMTHIWGHSSYLTSGAAAQLSGLVGLVAAAYPDYGPDEIEAKILAAADDHVYDVNPVLPGEIGAGVTNAWKAVTYWGETTASELWSGEIWVSGDIIVPEGALLTIAAGTTVHIAADDVMASGTDPNRTEIIVDGTLACLGTSGAPVVFDVIADTPADEWGPIRVRGTGGQPTVQLEHCDFQNMSSLLRIGTTAGPATVSITDCTASTSGDGIVFTSQDPNHDLSIQGLDLTCSSSASATGIRITPQLQADPTILLGGGTTVTGYHTGVDVVAGSLMELGTLDINDCTDVGMQLGGLAASQPQVTGPVAIDNAATSGLAVLDGVTSVVNVTVTSSGGIGIVHNSDTGTHFDNVSVTGSSLWGFYGFSPPQVTLIENSTFFDNGVDGVRSVGGELELGNGVVISNSGQHAVYLDGTQAVVHHVAISDAGSAVDITNSGDARIHHATFDACYTGIGLFDSTADLGQGYNAFTGITSYFVANFHPTESVDATYNCWNGTTTPSSRKFQGSSPTIYIPGHCQ